MKIKRYCDMCGARERVRLLNTAENIYLAQCIWCGSLMNFNFKNEEEKIRYEQGAKKKRAKGKGKEKISD